MPSNPTPHPTPDPTPKPPLDPLSSAAWHALTTSHSHLALNHGEALRYPSNIAPFAALAHNTPQALHDLFHLLAPAESIYLLDPLPAPRPAPYPRLRHDGVVPCLQMLFPADLPPPLPNPLPIHPLTCAHAPEMLALIAIAFPGFFRAETCRMGRYFGVRDPEDGTLLAMGGERLVLHPPGEPVWREISGLCVHPTRAAGRGLGAAILTHILTVHHAEGSRSWLHVAADNTRAIALYHRLGFQTLRRIDLHRLERPGPLATGASVG